MMKLTKKVVASLLSVGLVFGASVPVQASEDNTVVLGSGSNSVRFSPGVYDVKVEMRKAGDEGSDSMAAGAIDNDAKVIVNEQGQATVQMKFVETTIMGCKGAALSSSIHQKHEVGEDTIDVTVLSTFDFKPGSTTYTALSDIEFDIPFTNENGVYAEIGIKYRMFTDLNMDQTAYFMFDYTPYRADYTAFDTIIDEYEANKLKYTTTSSAPVDEYIESASYCEPLDSQAVVDAQTAELATLIAGLELRGVEVRDAQMSASVAVNEATYMIEIPAEIGLGELSVEEDTKIPYEVSVEVSQGNNGTTTYQVSTDTVGELTSGNNKLAYGNTFDTQSFTETNTVEAYFVIEADTVAKAASGDYEGEVMFTITTQK